MRYDIYIHTYIRTHVVRRQRVVLQDTKLLSAKTG